MPQLTATRYHPPTGFDPLVLVATPDALTGLWFQNTPRRPNLPLTDHPQHVILTETCQWLDAYFQGTPPKALPPFCLKSCTSFQTQVLTALLDLPFGKTQTYGELAHTLARLRNQSCMSAQAIGHALSVNPICILIPCHRILGAHAQLTGYAGGLHNKQALLRHEQQSVTPSLVR